VANRKPGETPLADALVGIFQRQHDELFAHRLFEDDVEQRQQAVVQAFVAQLGEAFDRVAGGQQLEHFVEQAGGGTFSSRRPFRGSACALPGR
jgi:hypothetical protein